MAHCANPGLLEAQPTSMGIHLGELIILFSDAQIIYILVSAFKSMAK